MARSVRCLQLRGRLPIQPLINRSLSGLNRLPKNSPLVALWPYRPANDDLSSVEDGPATGLTRFFSHADGEPAVVDLRRKLVINQSYTYTVSCTETVS